MLWKRFPVSRDFINNDTADYVNLRFIKYDIRGDGLNSYGLRMLPYTYLVSLKLCS